MATSPLRLQQGYGIGNALQPLPPFTIIANRAPTQQDKARLGTFWTYTAANNVYVLTSVTGGLSNWLTLSNGGAGIFTSLEVNGPSEFNGNIVQQAPGVTASFLTTVINGSLTQNNGATLLNTDAGNQTVRIGDGAGIKTVTLGSTNTTSVTNINSGSGKTNFNGTIPGNPGRLNIVENGGGFVIVTSSNNAANTYHLFTQQLSNDAFAPLWSSFKNRAGATVQTNDLLFQQRVAATGPTGIADSVIMQYQTVGVLPATAIVPVQYTLQTGNSVGVLTTKLTVTPDGAVTMPAQPSFCAVITAQSAAGVTGNGTPYTIGSNAEATPTVYTKLYESTPNIVDAQGRFIAPVAGRYLFTAGVRMSAYAGVTNAQIQILAPTTIIVGSETCPPAALTAFFAINTSGIINLAQGAAVSVRINCNGQGADNTVVQGDGVSLLSYFTGALLN